mgnify:CR=1 FL=1
MYWLLLRLVPLKLVTVLVIALLIAAAVGSISLGAIVMDFVESAAQSVQGWFTDQLIPW